MPSAAATKLQKVTTFPQLVKYLREELGWPVEQSNFDDIVFDWDPEELGLDLKTSAKISEIKQLRPLTAGQPWGVFFVKFEPKELPVVALRRILSQVTLKKRAAANKAERAAWASEDLLFVSSYGVGTDRQLTFAHFSQSQEKGDLPTLKVLGWDARDTVPHLDAVAKALSAHLKWPDNPKDTTGWRAEWREAVVRSPQATPSQAWWMVPPLSARQGGDGQGVRLARDAGTPRSGRPRRPPWMRVMHTLSQPFPDSCSRS